MHTIKQKKQTKNRKQKLKYRKLCTTFYPLNKDKKKFIVA